VELKTPTLSLAKPPDDWFTVKVAGPPLIVPVMVMVPDLSGPEFAMTQ